MKNYRLRGGRSPARRSSKGLPPAAGSHSPASTRIEQLMIAHAMKHAVLRVVRHGARSCRECNTGPPQPQMVDPQPARLRTEPAGPSPSGSSSGRARTIVCRAGAVIGRAIESARPIRRPHHELRSIWRRPRGALPPGGPRVLAVGVEVGYCPRFEGAARPVWQSKWQRKTHAPLTRSKIAAPAAPATCSSIQSKQSSPTQWQCPGIAADPRAAARHRWCRRHKIGDRGLRRRNDDLSAREAVRIRAPSSTRARTVR